MKQNMKYKFIHDLKRRVNGKVLCEIVTWYFENGILLTYLYLQVDIILLLKLKYLAIYK